MAVAVGAVVATWRRRAHVGGDLERALSATEIRRGGRRVKPFVGEVRGSLENGFGWRRRRRNRVRLKLESSMLCRWLRAHGVTTTMRLLLLFNRAMAKVGVGQRKRLVGVEVPAINVLDGLA